RSLKYTISPMDEKEAQDSRIRPVFELVLFFAAFYLVAYLPADPSLAGAALGTASFHLQNLVLLVPRAAFLIYFMARTDGRAAFGLGVPAWGDLPRAAAWALGALVVALASSVALGGQGNAFLEAAGAPSSPPLVLIPLVLASALAVGYGEELFFRCYAITRLEQAGLAGPWAAIASSLVFGSAHGIQGIRGLVIATILGLWFSWRWLVDRSLHQIALGHAIYDAVVMLAAIYGPSALG
ncbi:MAG: type II CAAX endopeptidase family protein, partial [Spirochaetaceae bacterium]|nr:type II CAAX endopeptidase family protein [Spirochaetaceae bacterium]